MFCPKCGNSLDDSAKYCPSCGAGRQLDAESVPPPQTTIDTDSRIDEFYKAAVGPKNQSYYLNQFTRFDNQGEIGVSWHWPAFFFTFYWLLYRKMWRPAIIYFFLPYLVMFPAGFIAGLTGHAGGMIISIIYLIYMAGIFLLPPMYANALYYKHCKKQIAKAGATSPERQSQLAFLSGKGGTSRVIMIIVFVFIAIALIGILAAIAIPQYQEYVTRGRMAEAVATGRRAADSVGDYYTLNQRLPDSLAEAGFNAPLPTSVSGLGVNSQNGTITITLASTPLAGKSLLLVPSLDANRKVIWTCMSKDIQDRHLPALCRQNK